VKLLFNIYKSCKDICVIKLNIVYYQGAKMIMDKLGTFIKKSCVISIGFNNEILAATKSGKNSKVFRYDVDKKAGLFSSRFQYPCKHTTTSFHMDFLIPSVHADPFSYNHCGPDVYSSSLLRISSTHSFPLEIVFPIMIASGT